VTGDLHRLRIEQALERGDIALGRPLSIVDVTASTNDDAKAAAHHGIASGAAFVADAQTGGRGRLGRAWHSPPGKNLYASFVLRPDFATSAVGFVTLAAGLAVADAIAPLVLAQVWLKWPNDVLVSDRKIAGVLCEASVSAERTFIVVGIGLNVRTTDFPSEIAQNSTSLALAGARDLDRSAVFVSLASALSIRIAMLTCGETDRIVREFSARALALPDHLG
jgi:BirA family transcriptional regulator, biotin operon repressor / biotin---[acetyl-CoA-carboxylase] ligase